MESVISRSTETLFGPDNGKRGRHDTIGGGIHNNKEGQGKGCNRDLSVESWGYFHGDRTSQFDFPPLSHVDRRTAIDRHKGLAQKPRNNRRRTALTLSPFFSPPCRPASFLISCHFIRSVENFQKNNLRNLRRRGRRIRLIENVITITKFQMERSISKERERERNLFRGYSERSYLLWVRGRGWGKGGCLLRISCRIYRCAVSRKSYYYSVVMEKI